MIQITYGKLLRFLGNILGILLGQLHQRMRGKYTNKPGGEPVLSSQEETRVVERITAAAAAAGFPLILFDMRLIVKGYLDRLGRK